jgi:hypothetical protein
MLTCKTSDSGYEIGITTHKANKKIKKKPIPNQPIVESETKKINFKKKCTKKII